VFLLLGNRDINKIRFSSELNLQVPPEKAFHAWWDEKAPKYADYLKEHKLADSVTNRLQWALKHTLGCPHTFELRRQELCEIGRKATVSDDEVTESFVKGVMDDDGFYHEYLKRGELAVRLENTLFVHGAAEPRGLGFVPSLDIIFVANSPEKVTGAEYEDLDVWIEKLSEFKTRAIEDWRASLHWKNGRRGGDALLAYQNKPSIQNRTVCVTNYVDGKNMTDGSASASRAAAQDPRVNPLDESAWKFLKAGGIKRVCVGHTPSGNAPAVLRAPDGREVVSADTNYASASGDRGDAVAEVILDENDRTRLRGVSKGLEYDCYLDEFPIGTQVEKDGQQYWVKLRYTDGKFLLSHGSGRNCEDLVTGLS
jgi:hypothetical protein